MGSGKDKEKDSGGASGILPNCMETKVLMGTILVMGVMLITGQFLPFGGFGFGSRSCDKLAETFLQEGSSSVRAYSLDIRTTGLKKQALEPSNVTVISNVTAISNVTVNGGEAAKSEEKEEEKNVIEEEEEEKNVTKRVFRPYGNAAYLFIQMSAYRGGESTFAVVGLASKPIHVYGKPGFECEWIPKNSTLGPVKGKTYKMLPDWGYGRVYTVVVVNCSFEEPVGADGGGGQLILYANNGEDFEHPERIVALTEKENAYNASLFTAPPRYNYLYCGSSLYGNLSPQRMREWMAYHVKFFGPRSHFVFHDAGGVHEEVRKVLEPWIAAGRVTLQDIREQERFDGYYHNQFLIVNDCLHRYKFLANWTFYFDVDEFMYIPKGKSIESVVKQFDNYTQFTIEQYPMSNKLCLERDGSRPLYRDWGIEKLVFKDVKKGIRRDRKYAIQSRNAYATGVHMSENIIGKSQHQTVGKIRYYHYHGTISSRAEPCRQFVKPSMKDNITMVDGIPYTYDGTLKDIAGTIKKFELQQIGPLLTHTRQ
ncbi:hypothetical protein SUGI_0799510 [Cryptomeria japonica]|uniref:galactan beta-1,4-galactosyltransferase GALS1 n=1 Tax=Cryptomeria japonica TaxID=3369 RepID=UPI0024147999|nr:galactan beta-1,4-galactosyltransferase GALS1 [Cryptomeria japonica]GLJ39204.1 hypothetical protein SUGI_0799510 [Cryptomeria japonica]